MPAQTTSSSTSATTICSASSADPGYEHPAWQETIGGVQHLAISVTTDQFDSARKKLDEAGVDYLGPDRGADNSMYFRDPNGVGLELYREDLGKFEGELLVD